MAFPVLKQKAGVYTQRGFESPQPRFGWLRRNFLRLARVQQQQQPTIALTSNMEALYALALAVVDEHGLD